ncbi:MAG: hypothetical protein ACHQ8D_15910, partial [Candidatus Rokuibacteriota bacterium]
MSRTSGSLSRADDYLRDELGHGDGLESPVLGKQLADWIGYGAAHEDDFPRFLNHFHNPLATTWSQAGLGGSVGQSSIIWAQNTSQSAPSWSWQDSRRYYFEALTNTSKASRDTRLAATFEALGRQIHVIQDSASPAHARNDPHLLYNYESLVENVRVGEASTFQTWLDREPDIAEAPASGWRSLDSNPLAAIAVARLIDADRYSGSNPAVTTEALIGLAEYTNANFFSEDRVFTENDLDPQARFPFPKRSSVV